MHPLARPVEDGVVFFLDKVEETIRACDNLLLTWKTHDSPLGTGRLRKPCTEWSLGYWRK